MSSDAPAHLGNVDGVAGTLTIDGGLGSNTLEVSDYGKTTGAVNATLTANQIMEVEIRFTRRVKIVLRSAWALG